MQHSSDAHRARDAAAPSNGSNGHSGGGERGGRLYLWFPVGTAMRKVRTYLRRIDRAFHTAASGALSVDASDGYPDELLSSSRRCSRATRPPTPAVSTRSARAT